MIDSGKKSAIFFFVLSAPVAELVDAADSKSVDLTIVLVRFRPGAPFLEIPHLLRIFFIFKQVAKK